MRAVHNSKVLSVALSVFWGILLVGTTRAAPPVEDRGVTYTLDIPAQSLNDALQALALASQHKLLYDADLVEGKTSAALKGQFTAEEAVKRLLSGTELSYEVTSDGLVMIRAANVPSAMNEAATADESSNSSKGIAEIVVTGTHMRGAQSPVGSKITVIDNAEIVKSGYATIQEFIKTLPQNSGSGVSRDFVSGDPGANNLNRGTAINLRGLGADSTLVLVNGHRQPGGGFNASFVDISSIATAAVERIEVLTDGASALYGSDAVGGVVNFVLRKDYEGAHTTVRLGSLDGGASDHLFSQLIGSSWGTGNALLGYQFSKRGRLEKSDRAYAASDDLTRYGGTDYRSTGSNPGNILDPDSFEPRFAIPVGQDGTGLTVNDLQADWVNYHESSEQGNLLPKEQMHSVFASLSQRLTPRVEIFGEGRFSTRDNEIRRSGEQRTLAVPSSNPFFLDPFGGSTEIFIDYNFIHDLGPITQAGTTETFAGSLGANINISPTWQVRWSTVYGRDQNRWSEYNIVNDEALNLALNSSDRNSAFNPFADASLSGADRWDSLRANHDNRAVASIKETTAVFDGPLLQLPDGLVRVAFGADYREEDLRASETFTGLDEASKHLNRQVSAAFMELTIPLLSSRQALPLIRRADLSIAGRYDRYSDFGEAFNPKLGLDWFLGDKVKVRGTWGASFKAPRLASLLVTGDTNVDLRFNIPDPESPTGRSPSIVRLGNNSELSEETATVWTAGFDYSTGNESPISLSMTYYEIAYEDRVAAGGPPGNPLNILFQESQWSEVISRIPSPSELAEICGGPFFVGASCDVNPPVVIVDLRLRNLASVDVSGLDLSIDKLIPTRFGSLSLGMSGSYTLEHELRASATSPPTDVLDTVLNPSALHLRGFASWSRNRMTFSAFSNYTNAYEDRRTSGVQRTVDSWSTLDLNFSYMIDESRAWFGSTHFSLSVVNALNKRPPFVDFGSFLGGAIGYDPANANPLGRMVSVQLEKTW